MTDDDDLRARLRRADPAAALEPAAPEQVSRLVEETMSRTHTRRWALPVAAALVLVAAGTAWAMTRPSEPAPVVKTTQALEAELTASGVSAKCREPEAGRLSEISDFAFEGTVTRIDGGTVHLDVTELFRGDRRTTSARVAQTGETSEQMLGSGTFEQGKKYLVASTKGTVLICGYSGEADAVGLRELYEAAF
ncbi:hypothetical protein [Actinoplanes utahensis]|uniref:Uncharacterized protein n=1 Tax=Actinoplanes utahensis TaxID=1869 RepID=A0A0A6X058_ACTUT|nr:hypothetical protein [Actinoplanes utahensis]KHD73387.1 hypothetical protein MB27_34735 [Actinoplanes utahensis]GIF30140.1 hypothetical protein Aut01nite_31260 [Actinoplanes utahensis]